MNISAGKLWSYRRLSDNKGTFKMLATDQRPPIMEVVKENKKSNIAPDEDISQIKKSLIKCLAEESSAILIDPIWGYPTSFMEINQQKGLIITLEEHNFYESSKGRISSEIPYWSVAKIKSLGADGVKFLVWYRPDSDTSTCDFQQKLVERIGQACIKYDILFLLELLIYPLTNEKQNNQYNNKTKYSSLVIDSAKLFSDKRFGVDILKLQSPLPANEIPELNDENSVDCQEYFNKLGYATSVPWVMLSAGTTIHNFYKTLQYAYKAGASGYLAGRAIWLNTIKNYFPDISLMEQNLRNDSVNYMKKLNDLTNKYAKPWHHHKIFKGNITLKYKGYDFPQKYDVLF
jgi:tagatose 1,6-diphosphate aldolase